MIQCKWAQLFSILHFSLVTFLWQVLILTLESDAVVSAVCYIYFFLQTLGHHSLFVKLLRFGLAIGVFTSSTTLLKIWNLRNLFHAWRRNVKYQRLALEEVNVTFITYFSEKKKRQRKNWKIKVVCLFFHLFHLCNKQRFARDWQAH